MNFPINIEQWRLVSGYDNYEVSSHGRVRNNKTNLILKIQNSTAGYKQIGLNRGGEKKKHGIHRLVAFAFLDRTDEQTEVDHLNHDRSNNMLDNLRWVTKSVNQRNASRRTDNISGTSGVSFHNSTNSWRASWQDANMRHKNKFFSVKRYGNDEAKQLAINYRRERARENGYLNV